MKNGTWPKVADRLKRFHGWDFISQDAAVRKYPDPTDATPGRVDLIVLITDPRNARNARPGDVLVLISDATSGEARSVDHLIRCGDWRYADDIERAITNYADDVLPALLRDAYA